MKPFQKALSKNDFKRKLINRAMTITLIILSFVALIPLFSVFVFALQKGLSGINLDFFLHLPKPVGETGGGMANALMGSVLLVLIASAIGVPIGVLCGVYLSEYGTGKLSKTLKISTDLLASVPSIVVGLFAYAILVVPFGGFSTLAGAFALAIILVPIVIRTTEEVLKLTPNHIREAGLALGLPKWKVIIFIVVRGSLGGILTGVILAIARVSGETAPLLFTAFNNHFWSTSLTNPIASLPVQIYTYAISPFEDWHRQAWAAALILILFVFLINITIRLIFMRKS